MIKILYFASLREQVGRASDEIEFNEPLTVLEAWKKATGETEILDTLLVALNQEYTSTDTLLNDGDELAFFPPVTGG